MATNYASVAKSRIKKKAEELLNKVSKSVQNYYKQAPTRAAERAVAFNNNIQFKPGSSTYSMSQPFRDMARVAPSISRAPIVKPVVDSYNRFLTAAGNELYNPSQNIGGFTRNVAPPLIEAGANAYGASKLKAGFAAVSAGLGGVISKATGGSFIEGAERGLNTAPMINAIGSFTNPSIIKLGSTAKQFVANPIGKQVSGRVAQGIANIPEGMLMRRGMGLQGYSPTDAAIDFGIGAVGPQGKMLRGKTLSSQKGKFEVIRMGKGKMETVRTYDTYGQAKKALKMISKTGGGSLTIRDVTPDGMQMNLVGKGAKSKVAADPNIQQLKEQLAEKLRREGGVLPQSAPTAKSIEQLGEAAGGWKPGDKVKFDTALFKKDKKALGKLLQTAPPEYRARFSNEINDILTAGDKMVASSIKVGKDGKVLVKMKEVKTPLEVESQLRTGQTQQIQAPGAPPTNQIRSYNDGIPPPDGSQDPVSKIIQAIRGAKPLRAKQEAMYSKARAQRVARVAGVGERIPGEAGFHAQLGQLKGELPKVQFESIRKQVTQKEVDSLFNIIEKTPMSPFEKVTAKGGLAKLLGAEGGAVPTRGELKLLNEIFPQEFTDAVLSQRTNIQKLFALGENALNLPRSVMATADLSAPLRQGVFLIGRPKQWIPAFRDMFKYAFSEKAYDGLQADIRSRPTYQLMRQNKLAITDMGNVLESREEAFMSNLAERAPIFGRIAKGSNRAYSGFLNKLRADTFDDLVSKAKVHGIDFQENPKALQDIAKFVNSATGRGDLGALNKAAPVLNGIFFSPRLMASRMNLINPKYYVDLDPFVRKEALKSLITFAGTAATILGLAKLGGANVGTDPRSADFGKIKVGNTRWDPWGGFQQYMVLGSRLISGEMVSSTTGKEFKLGEGGYKPTTRADIIQRFLESKEAPVMSFAMSLLKGKTSIGEDVSIPVEIIDRFIPMIAGDIYDLTKEWGPAGALLAAPGMFGVGSQTYQDQVPVESKTATGRPSIKWRAAPGLGEDILNRVTGKQVSTIPKDQWKPLVEERRTKTLKDIDETKAKATVLETGEPQRVGDKVFYLKNGIVESSNTSSSIKIPEFTGDEAKDKKLRQATYLKIGQSAKGIKQLMEENLIDPYEAETKLNELEALKNKIKGFSPTSTKSTNKSTKKKTSGGKKSSRGRGKAKIAKIKIPKFGKVKTAKVKVKTPKLKKLSAAIKQSKGKKVKIAKVKKSTFKLKAKDRYESFASASSRYDRTT